MILFGANTVTPFTEKVGVPLVVAAIALAATIGAAAMTFALGRWADTLEKRRGAYASATRELVAWAEYPYRIKRRPSDDRDALAALTDAGHALQEALRYRGTWIRAENGWVADVFDAVRADLGAELGASCADAWKSDPIIDAEDMILGDWGPVGVDEHIKRFERAVAFRFGWRRIPALFGWHPGG
jgi:peptidoglycan/xylan/chitin deacetylase (PgdA/CDA1 family)